MSAIAPRIQENTSVPGVRLLRLRTATPDIAMLRFSFKAGFLLSDDMRISIPSVLVGLLDKGTKKKHKETIRKLLAAKGLSVHFSAGSHFSSGSFYFLKEDSNAMLSLGSELFKMPSLSQEEIDLYKEQAISDATLRRQDTEWRARQALRSALYPEGHYLYAPSVEEEIKGYQLLTRKKVQHFHETYFGRGTIQAVLAGDVSEKEEREVLAMFRSWKSVKNNTFKKLPEAFPRKHTTINIEIKDKANVSFMVGQALALTRNHPDYYPLLLGVMILGDDFSARLMQEVREKRGLTYGIAASLTGFEDAADGYFVVRAGFAPDKLKEGEAATLAEIERLVAKGVTEEELISRKENYLASFVVGYATTSGLVGDILSDAELGRPKEFIDQFPQLINAITLKQVNDAIKKHIDPSKLVIVKAGSL